MSTQSILHKSRVRLLEESSKVIDKMADSYLKTERFGIGKGYDRQDYLKLVTIQRVLHEGRCRLLPESEMIKEKLNLLILKYN